MLTWLAKVALGGTFNNARINGSTTIVGGGASITVPSGAFALPTNIGNFSDSRFAVAPELALTLSYQVAPQIRVFAGYNFVYWTGVVRPGGTIDTTINPNQLPGGTLVGPARPQPLLSSTDYWVHGVNFGLSYNF